MISAALYEYDSSLRIKRNLTLTDLGWRRNVGYIARVV